MRCIYLKGGQRETKGMGWRSFRLELFIINIVRFVETVQLIFLSNISGLNKRINSNIKVFTTTFRYMHIMYYICISIHAYKISKI